MEKKKNYAEYFYVPREYKPNMDSEVINQTPELWLNFYPHKKYVEFLKQLLATLEGGDKSIWLTGNYGTGKSYAALVTQKLFMDDQERVKKWFEKRKLVIENYDVLEGKLFELRREGTFVVYDYNAAGIDGDEGFLVRLERTIIAALKDSKMIVPEKSSVDEIIIRVVEEGDNFLRTLENNRGELAYLKDYKKIEEIVADLKKGISDVETHAGLMADVQNILRSRSIFLSVTVPDFKKWVEEVLKRNKLKRIIYIFDEFSSFFEKNKSNLKTFEEVAEKGLGKFFFVPVTHLSLEAFWGDAAQTAQRAIDRFHFFDLQMPTNTAFQLAADALKPFENNKAEWEQERSQLWSAISVLADNWFSNDDVGRQAMHDIIPIHPMSAFLLKFLSTSIGSNQRSLFEYLKGGANGQEFQEFISTGGPEIENKQFLTPDYLWKYFIERDDLGQKEEVLSTRLEFNRIYNREFKNRDDDDSEIRVLKTVLLFCLLSKLNPDGHERLKPTVENIEISFIGDGYITNVRQIINTLADKHCFSLNQDFIEPYYSSIGSKELDEEILKIKTQFQELLISDEIVNKLTSRINMYKNTLSNRFKVKISDIAHFGSAYFKEAANYLQDSSDILLWFIVAKNKEEQLKIPEKINSFLNLFVDHRVICISFQDMSFCRDNQDAWDSFISLYAKYNLEIDKTAKEVFLRKINDMRNDWYSKIILEQTRIQIDTSYNNRINQFNTPINWSIFKSVLENYVKKTLPQCPDLIVSQVHPFSNAALKGWAKAGLVFDTSKQILVQSKATVNEWKNEGITDDSDWFSKNPRHCLTEIHGLFEKELKNTIIKGGHLSVRKVYSKLMKPPFGLKYNALSAFVLGFVLKDLLRDNYQWTNGQIAQPLDEESLAGIIEEVVKDDGNNNIRLEKEICKLSKKEKAFVDLAPRMFGIVTQETDSTVETALSNISNRITQLSKKVPLWVLPLYIKRQSDPQSELLERIVCLVCASLSSSSKNGEDRLKTINELGEILLENEGIGDSLANYMRPENFISAFSLFVSDRDPELKKLAEELGDSTYNYLESIERKSAETAGWLWKEADLSVSIESTKKEYMAIKALSRLFKTNSFIPFSEYVKKIKHAVVSQRIPKILITKKFLSLSSFLDEIEKEEITVELANSIIDNIREIMLLFFDNSYNEPLKILKDIQPDIHNLSSNELVSLYNDLKSDYYSSESSFISELNQSVEDYFRNSIASKIKNEWKRISGKDSPNEWAESIKIPARVMIGNDEITKEIIHAINNPFDFSQNKLKDLLLFLQDFSGIRSNYDIKTIFLKELIPERYQVFCIDFEELVQFLTNKFGGNPNDWPPKADVSEFLNNLYKTQYSTIVSNTIKKTDAEELKIKICKIAELNPEIGLLFLE